MRIIEPQRRGEDVQAWQTFMRGQDVAEHDIDGVYDEPRISLNKAFQAAHGLVGDGVIGARTFGQVQALGFNLGCEGRLRGRGRAGVAHTAAGSPSH